MKADETNIPAYRQYVREASSRTVSREQETQLAHRIVNNDREALDLLVEPHLGLALEYADTYYKKAGPAANIAEYIRVANTGLFRAALAYGKGKGKEYSFEEYASWWVRRSLEELVNEQLPGQ